MQQQQPYRLFTIHSPITFLGAKLIIEQEQLDPAYCRFFIRESMLKQVLEIARPEQIFVYRDYMHEYGLQFADDLQFVTAYISSMQTLYDYLGVWLDKDYKSQTPTYFDSFVENAQYPYGGTSQRLNCDFVLYTQHLVDLAYYHLAEHPNCIQLHFFEDGSINYIDQEVANAIIVDWSEYVEKYADENPELSYSASGIHQNDKISLYLKQILNNPQVKANQTYFYILSTASFKYWRHLFKESDFRLLSMNNVNQENPFEHQQKYSLTPSNIKPLVQANDSYQSPMFEIQQKYYLQLLKSNPEFAELLNDPSYYGNYVNILCFEGLGQYLNAEHYFEATERLIQEVKHHNLPLVFIKFHPQFKEEHKQQVYEILDREQMVYLEINSDSELPTNLEQEFQRCPRKTFVVHAISSSVLIYAAILGQYAISYNHIGKYYPEAFKLYNIERFDVPLFIKDINQSNGFELVRKQDFIHLESALETARKYHKERWEIAQKNGVSLEEV